MKLIANLAEVQWTLQDLRERLVMAQAEQVKIERRIREVVREPRNRRGIRQGLYTDPAKAVAALRSLQHLAYLIQPGMKQRISPGVLLARHERAVTEVTRLSVQIKDLEYELNTALLDAAQRVAPPRKI